MDFSEVADAFRTEKLNSASITVEELEGLITDYTAKRKVYEEQKSIASGLYKETEEAENKVVEALQALGKKSYKVEGLGTFTRVMKEVVTVPKELDKKRAFFDWIKSTYGADVLDTMVSVNHQTLNSFYRQEAEKHQDEAVFSIPGIEAPTSTETVSFRKA